MPPSGGSRCSASQPAKPAKVELSARRRSGPGRLDLARRPAGDLAFGLGPHFCAGAGLARLEAAATFAGLAARLEPDSGWQAEREHSHVLRRLRSLRLQAAARSKARHIEA
ncbi:MAG TPA: hypothetical protein VHX88_11620 [Solirubrobacteraceae bacterium]|nr:hypothetical protein [Solirubrobacteraceae bacterium]